MTPPANSPPLCGTHTDAEFAALKAELAASHAQVAAKDKALEMMIDILRKHTWGPYDVRPVVAIAEQALAVTAPAEQAGKERAT
jgi:hypothetical protein